MPTPPSTFLARGGTLALAALLAVGTMGCLSPDSDDSTNDVVVGSNSSELTYDRTGRSYTAKFEILARDRLISRAEDEQKFHDILTFVYGDYDAVKAEAIRRQILAGDFSWAPDIQLVPTRVLKGGAAAYSEDTGLVYLSEDVPNRFQRTMIYLEEIGHHLDVVLKDSDTPGDEGGLFRIAMFGAPVSAELEAQLRGENDHGTIRYRGRQIEVEFFFLFDWLEDGWEMVVDEFAKTAIGGFWAIIDQFVIVNDAIKTAGLAITQGGASLALGLTKLAEGDLKGGLKHLFEGAVALSIKPVASLLITVVLHEIAALQHIVFGPGRRLNATEKVNARKVFGDVWWLNAVRVVEGRVHAGVFGVSGDAFTLEYTIYLKDKEATPFRMIHELAHSFQFASGDGTYKLMSLYERITIGPEDMYKWRPAADSGKMFTQFGVEQQAAFVAESFHFDCFDLAPWQQCHLGGINRTALFNSARSALISGIVFEGVLPPALTTAVVF